MAFSASLTLGIIRNYKLRCGWSISKWTSTKTRRLDGFPLGGRGRGQVLTELSMRIILFGEKKQTGVGALSCRTASGAIMKLYM